MLRKIFLLGISIIIMTTLATMGFLFFMPVEPQNVAMAYSPGETNIVMEDEFIHTDVYPIIDGEKIFIPLDIFKKYIHEDIRFDEQKRLLYLNIEEPQFELETEELTERLDNGVNLTMLVRNLSDNYYVELSGYEKIFNIEITYIEKNNIVIIDKVKEKELIGTIDRKTYLRPEKSSFSFKLDKLRSGDKVKVFEQENKWSKVRTEEGYIGYVKSRDLDVEKLDMDLDVRLNTVREDWNPTGKINFAWEYVYRYTPDISEEDAIEGLDVVSPTWFSIIDDKGTIENKVDYNYIMDAHDKGYKVWALMDNSFDKDLTKKVLSSEEAQNNVINQILVYTSMYNIDGINLDFENVYYEDKDRLTQFVDKLTKALKKQNLVVSMDFTIPSSSLNWSKFYDRERISEIVDYCMVMTYDEHWASSPKSGSVASIGWVESGIEKTLRYVPKEKLLLGIPFYTREWEETRDEKGNIDIKSSALSMKTVDERIIENNLVPKWLNEEGQYYVEYTKDNKRYRIWIEDQNSIGLKAQLVHEYDLAGAASWRKGFEKEGIWTVLKTVIKDKNKIVRQ
ncbi:glycosyl hydrolase family 18 protein [Clostridiisalibacter paucivorans]|uniref:glycosyl hydrolase family 18 protein n=1 Tax=Clostridiisalibacter paucivorans TaxID=408753 RepID=UPI0006868C09|nr:glycosyl hydrolase family 18 protein [Clostridiisalibacter paucivorans]